MYTDYKQLPLYLSVQQLADTLGIGRNTAYELVRSGRIRSVRYGKQFRIPKSVLMGLEEERIDCTA